MKDWEDKLHIGCLFIGIAYVLFGIVCCIRSGTKHNEKKQISDEERYIADSIAYEKRVKEKKEEEERERLIREQEEIDNKRTLAIIYKSDSVYHITTKCDALLLINFDGLSIKDFRLTTIEKAKSDGYELCFLCEERESVYRKYENREIVDYEDVPLIAFEEFDMIDKEDSEDDYDDWEERDYYDW